MEFEVPVKLSLAAERAEAACARGTLTSIIKYLSCV
jgi:hypothetical protein